MIRFVLMLLLLVTTVAKAWVYPEHRDAGVLAIGKLNAAQRALLEQLWAEARAGHEGRLSPLLVDPSLTTKPTSLDYASWMAIAGDHSCSPSELVNTVLYSNWILRVADIAAQLKINLAHAKNGSQLINALRESDIRFQRADMNYATRAGSNNVHFLLARNSADEEATAFFAKSLKEGAELNAIAAYAWVHQSALQKASRYAETQLTAKEKSSLALAALADEAFAIHFLEDVFSAGHIAGTWGKASLRKGTHDYYNEKGLEVITWDGQKMVLKGDAYMRTEDAAVVSEVVKISLEQLLDAVSSTPSGSSLVVAQPDTFDVCKALYVPTLNFNPGGLRKILMKTPLPGLASGLGEIPRFRSELGLFIGASTSLTGSSISGGFGKEQKDVGGIGGIDANAMIGYGLDGVLNQSGDGLIFLQLGWRQDSPSTTQFVSNDPSFPANSITSVIPGRSAYNVRLRLPFWLVPGDLIAAAPFLGFTSPTTLQKMGVGAVNGGALGWQSAFATPIGRFQFIAGREVGISFYGLGKVSDALFVVDATNQLNIVTYRSTKFDFPFLEYRPLRSFSQDQSSTLKVQFSFGVDVPYHYKIIAPANASELTLKPVWYFGTRILFNWRHYF
jgi:hypothetical protein